jgi:AcrR family transcriptional regulator
MQSKRHDARSLGVGRQPRTQAQRSDETILELVSAARDLFCARGYVGTSIEDIVTAARMTRGAFYHHFDSKLSIFSKVFEMEERALTASVAVAASQGPDAWSRFETGCVAFLGAALEPSVRQIYLLDGPAVLGWDSVREIEERSSMALLQVGLEQAVSGSGMEAPEVMALTHLLMGALCEGGLVIARSGQPEEALRVMTRQVRPLILGIREAVLSSGNPNASNATVAPRARKAKVTPGASDPNA